MDKEYEEAYHQIEEWNWWFVSRRKAILSLLKNTDKKTKILDIGCAGGPLLNDLKKEGFENISGADFSEEAVAKCKQRGLQAYEMDAHNLQFEPNSFDMLVASDSLEHLEFDEKALKNWFTILKPGGKLLVFVPAYLFLWSEHDTVNHHYRRYTKTELTHKLEQAGFTVKRSGYWNFMMFFPTAVFRILQQVKNKISPTKKPKNQLESFNPVVNKILITWLKVENAIFKTMPFPCGVSVFAEVTKPNE
ncbi:MAG: class I SAM-dependent methyltransferase [Bacteroidia bacterium]